MRRGLSGEVNCQQLLLRSHEQASLGAVTLMVESLLGLVPLALRCALLVDPALPDWLPELTIVDVAVGPRRATLRFRRDGAGHTEVKALDAGGLKIVLPAPARPGRDRPATLFRPLVTTDRLGRSV